jgi:hypothetical protein
LEWYSGKRFIKSDDLQSCWKTMVGGATLTGFWNFGSLQAAIGQVVESILRDEKKNNSLRVFSLNGGTVRRILHQCAGSYRT